MATARSLQVKLALLSFLEFGVWGAYLISLGNYLARIGLATQIGWFYTVQGIVSLFMPAIIGILADRWIQAQKMLSLCHILAGCFMGAAGVYCLTTSQVEFGPLFALYTLSVAFFMPTIGLGNSVAFNALTEANLDTIKHFPPIRVFGTVGFICSMLFVNFTQFQTNAYQLITSAALSFILAAYALTMPACKVKKGQKSSLADSLGLKAFKLFKQKRMAIFFIFSMFLGVSLQITNSYGNTFITSFENLAEFADTWGAHNANALISLSQISETLCILLIPFCLKRFGIKGVMLMSMFAWVLRFGFFGIGDTGSGLWLLILSCIVYGVAFDFFNVSGGLYVDKETTSDLRSSAQGLFMMMTNGLGATIGTLCAQAVVNHFVFSQTTAEAQHQGWITSWMIFAGYALVVAVLFMFIFKDDSKKASPQMEEAVIDGNGSAADGMVND
ncbi:MFS transporter [Duncaniella muris]|jgi:nucleoside transporter|uniref:MFS transporter n=2 Tax=Muribaculaceae TaxID=2005473 RepID=UPI000F47EA6E|nr:MFS transporter [Duncaniella muris]NBH92879.1 MFS transporter [Muribaculaceae bacterium S4]NBI21279.1 MFS transporter [Muribaculaceae bacterium Z1]ROT00219.1 MFS transporter [Muribaculaceae bacterium Isolate-083 (Janvier)]ROT00406.1 MFS transporter [Muribaculaceae bacterium Isolate-077 (Janvier)]ROT02711.1 MFS transporter [Muribaculaceae bacterium Isolate-084 (Janvier)]